MQTVEELQQRARELESEINDVRAQISQRGSMQPVETSATVLPPPGKSGYLFKWQDRSIGWSGTKWALRFVNLDRGRISYFYNHLETSARYMLSLRGCAVRDEGWKRNRRHPSKVRGKDPPLEEVGAYFFVFSVYYRSDSANPGEATEFVPLLRFSTPSLAEKTQWIQLISEACAYCETDSFLLEEARRNEEEALRRRQQMNMAEAMPQAQRGTLPPLYFAPDKRAITRKPSSSNIPKSKMFRTQSKSRDAEKSETKGFPPSKPMHRDSAPSFLSSEASTQNYRGFFNLAMIILVVSNFRLVLNSVRRHGFVLSNLQEFSKFSIETWEQFPFLSGILLMQFFIVASFSVEWLLAHGKIYDSLGMLLHLINAHCSFIASILIVWNFVGVPAIGGCLLLNAAITWMKLISYALANQDYRLSGKNREKSPHETTLAFIDNLDAGDTNIEYPRNVTLGNLYYFWLAPTLTYQIAFPKTPRVRPLRVIGILVRMVIAASLFSLMIAQLVTPNLENLLSELEATNGKYTYRTLAEYGLKLSITNVYLWLLVFYFYFHLYLNLFAELLRFGDRVFYKDWWNSTEVSAYWRLWNLPVHYWLVRHLFWPCIRWNIPKTAATFIVFFFSAVMHEVLISVPFHMLRPWSFLGMMGQIPLVVITKYLYRKFPGSSIGNILFWVSFCVVGQPMAILLYTIDYKYGKLHGDGAAATLPEQTCGVQVGGTCLLRY